MSLGDGASSIPAGWYPDPADETRLRRWDGETWTGDVILTPQDAPAPFSAPQPAASPMAGFSAPPQSRPPQSRPPAPPQFAEPPMQAPEESFASVHVDSVPPPPPSGPPSATSPLASSPPPDPYAPSAPSTPAAAPQFSTPPPSSPFGAGTQAPPPPSSPFGSGGAAAPPPNAPPPPASPPPTFAPPGAASPPNPPSGPVSLPEWATLPGLTLPPDLSGIAGLETESILGTPHFEDVKKVEIRPDWDAEHPEPEAETEPVDEPAPYTHPTPAKDYAPPPAGAQYDVPPPPGATRAPADGPVLPPSALPDTRPPVATRAAALQAELPAAPTVGVPPRVPPTAAPVGGPAATITVWAGLIALLPVIQFAAIYLLFNTLKFQFQPGIQWGVLAAPALFSLLFALADQRALVKARVERAPSPLLAIVPPVYLLVRAIDAGRSSALLLVAWLVFQVAAAAGVYFLLPDLLALAVKAIG